MTEVVYKLIEEKTVTFHLTVAKRSRPYIENVISLVCKQVKDLYIHDWVKLRRALKFLSQTIEDDPVIVGGTQIWTWV